MALQKEIELYNGITLTSAYILITDVTIDYHNSIATIIVNIYKDSTAYGNGRPEVVTNTHQCSGTSFTTYFSESVLSVVDITPLVKAYEWLLTLALYSDAIPV